MVHTRRPLQEKMALFWHNHFGVGYTKVAGVVGGVLGPKSNAHGPNEFLHVPYAKRLTAAVAQVIASMP